MEGPPPIFIMKSLKESLESKLAGKSIMDMKDGGKSASWLDELVVGVAGVLFSPTILLSASNNFAICK